MGAQLSAQYPRAVGGMREVLKFGAMILRLREVCLTCETNSRKATKGPQTKGEGIKAWIEKYSTGINYKTAMRFGDVAAGISHDFELPAAAQKQITFSELATAEEARLSEKLRLLQGKLFAFVDGTSQRSWLDKLRPPKTSSGKGGSRGGGRKALSPDEKNELIRTTATLDWDDLAGRLETYDDGAAYGAPLFSFLDDGPAVQAQIAILEEAIAKRREWLKSGKGAAK